MASSIIEVRDITYTYPGKESTENNEAILKGISFTIAKGEFVGIIGRNGSGKSTLAKLLNAIIIPDSGDVIVDGMNTKDETYLWDIRQKAGMVFQNPDNQLVATMVEEEVAFGPENLGISPEMIRQRVDEALALVNMEAFKGKKPHQLSGGQKQRIAIAGILAMAPDCIIFDEPTAMLDPVGRAEVIATIKKLNKEKGMTIIHITHNMEELIEADRILVIDEGKIILEGTPKDVFTQREILKKCHLGVPPMRELTYQLNQRGMELSERILHITEMAEEIQKQFPLKQLAQFKAESENEEPEIIEDGQSTPLLKIENLSHTYAKGTPFEYTALKNITASVEKGEFIGLIGHTGSGKTTLVQHLNALMRPTEGTVYLEGKDIFTINKKSLMDIRRQVGLIFQYPEHQLFEETVEKDVGFGPMKAGLPEKEIRTRVRWALEKVGLKDEKILEQSPFSLSGGQMRRVAIAGVLAMKPMVLILDEPTAGLDHHGKKEILKQIAEMHEEEGMTVILISHSMDDVATLADRIMVMEQGKMMMFDTPEVVFGQGEALKAIGLGIPEVTELMGILHHMGYPVNSNIYTMEKAIEEVLRIKDIFFHSKGGVLYV